MFISEKHSITLAPTSDMEVTKTVNDIERIYREKGYGTKVDMCTVSITVTAYKACRIGGEE